VVIAGLENNRLPTYKRSEESQSIIQIIRPAEESDLWRSDLLSDACPGK